MERRRIFEILNETMIMLRIGRRKYFSVCWEATLHCHISKISLWIGKYLSVGGENNYIEWKKPTNRQMRQAKGREVTLQHGNKAYLQSHRTRQLVSSCDLFGIFHWIVKCLPLYIVAINTHSNSHSRMNLCNFLSVSPLAKRPKFPKLNTRSSSALSHKCAYMCV